MEEEWKKDERRMEEGRKEKGWRKEKEVLTKNGQMVGWRINDGWKKNGSMMKEGVKKAGRKMKVCASNQDWIITKTTRLNQVQTLTVIIKLDKIDYVLFYSERGVWLQIPQNEHNVQKIIQMNIMFKSMFKWTKCSIDRANEQNVQKPQNTLKLQFQEPSDDG